MRLSQEQIEVIAYRIVHDLRLAGIVSLSEPDDVEATIRAVITDDLLVEERLNDEVRDIMRAHDAEIRRAAVEFHEMFRAIKAKLARERDIIL
jgi:hypothetical protein